MKQTGHDISLGWTGSAWALHLKTVLPGELYLEALKENLK
jgi:hypothetical protein